MKAIGWKQGKLGSTFQWRNLIYFKKIAINFLQDECNINAKSGDLEDYGVRGTLSCYCPVYKQTTHPIASRSLKLN